MALATAPGMSAARSAATRSITDAAGRTVRLPASVERVADPWPANNGMVLMLGGADKLVATSLQARRQPWFSYLYPRIERVPAAFDVTGEVNIETLIRTGAQVVLMAYGGALPRWMDVVRTYALPVVLMSNTSLDGLMTTARTTGEVLGPREAQTAASYVAYFDGNIRRLRSVTDALPAASRPRVLHTASAGILNVDGRKSLIDDWINVAGGTNAADVTGLGRPVTMEQVVAWNPDVIIVGTAPNGRNRDAILSDPRWAGIEAVRRRRVYVNPTGVYLWDRHSAEAALQVLWAAKLLHPDRFRDLDVRQETRAFYRRFFRHELTDAEFASIMNAVAP